MPSISETPASSQDVRSKQISSPSASATRDQQAVRGDKLVKTDSTSNQPFETYVESKRNSISKLHHV